MPRKRNPKTSIRGLRINPYKLFYHRHILHLQIEDLSAMSGIPVNRLRQFESGINCYPSSPRTLSHFSEIDVHELDKLEMALECSGELRAGKSDDFGTRLIAYRNQYYSVPPPDGTQMASAKDWKAKAVIFDFDGTLTKPGSTQTTWEAIWQGLGYNDNECGLLANRFFTREITHSQWCQLTLQKFRARNLNYDLVVGVAANIELIHDFDECMAEIQTLGIPMYIVSGSIWDVISTALGDRAKYFKRIEANAFGYNPDRTLGTITGTRFDFEGKGEFVKEVAKDLNILTSEILFIGNSINDVHVKVSGSRTLLVNPHITTPADRNAWDFYIPRMKSLCEVLPYVDSSWEARRATQVLQKRESTMVALRNLDELKLAATSVLGRYRRFSNEERATLVGLADRIRRPLLHKSQTRENFLIYAPPGSGKTFFIEELAKSLADKIKFVAIDLSKDGREGCEKKLEEVEGSQSPCLCMIDEVDGRKGENWPYDLIYKKLDLNEMTDRQAVVFVLIGSSGGTVKKLSDAITLRYKGKDMIDRILESAQHWAEIPQMGVGDTICVYASKILEAASVEGKAILEIEKFAAFHAVLTCHSPRQIKLLADQVVRRVQAGMTQVHFDHHFETGDRANKAFWQEHADVASEFGKQTFRVSE